MNEDQKPLLPHYENSQTNSDPASPPLSPAVNIQHEVRLHVYKRRWYILMLFSFMAGIQSLVYNSFQPMSKSAMAAFEWTQTDITMMANWGPISFFLFTPVSSWLLDTKGLRVSCLLGMFFIALGCSARCLPVSPPWVRWNMHFGQLCNGLGSPASTAAPPLLSAVWFPPRERTTATALAAMSKIIAFAVSFVAASFSVPEVYYKNCTEVNETRITEIENGTYSCIDGAQIPVPSLNELRTDIMHLMYAEAGLSILLLLLMVVYFPKRPILPPSLSATVKRRDFMQGLKDLRRHGSFWVLCVLYLLGGGVGTAWAGTMSLNLAPAGISQDEAEWIGFYSFLALSVAMIITAKIGDQFPRYMKWMISALCLTAALAFIPAGLMGLKILNLSTAVLYVLVIAGVIFGGSITPLFYEFGCDLTYPVGEGTANSILTMFNHAGAVLCLGVLMIHQLGNLWLTWVVVGAYVMICPSVLLLRERHYRLDVDKSDLHVKTEIIDPSLS